MAKTHRLMLSIEVFQVLLEHLNINGDQSRQTCERENVTRLYRVSHFELDVDADDDDEDDVDVDDDDDDGDGAVRRTKTGPRGGYLIPIASGKRQMQPFSVAASVSPVSAPFRARAMKMQQI
ncbi:uncharacterized protein SETTUDRAFT_31660 [Exserohilum turcica Et28A]|uniref:Uncharacterized protein n=1 Tax=Exserohilum turcicum (strain 28A) TaxID=671987 RepID=R0K2M6_EXST2|nr:uncharacterized protein SETTUDRAFT_31660 [Exserohilum turcica Et28A]EOA87393.1 hypothetical protein SETTUDRAFT_31660 [Exserohilum turcica Et28A]